MNRSALLAAVTRIEERRRRAQRVADEITTVWAQVAADTLSPDETERLTVQRAEVTAMVRSADEVGLRQLHARVLAEQTGRERTDQAARYRNDPRAWADEIIDWPAGQHLTPYQNDIIGAVPVYGRVAVRGPHGLGKALQLGVKIPTPTGWTTIGDVRPGDEVFDEHGKPCHVVAKSPVWHDDTYEVEFADGTVITTHGNHEWNAVDVYNRPKTPKPDRRPVDVADWRDHWAFTKQVTTAHMAERLRTRGGQLRWRIPAARALELPAADLPVDPYVFGYWLGDGASASGRITVHERDWPSLLERIEAAGYHHGGLYRHKERPTAIATTVSTRPVRRGAPGGSARDSMAGRLRTLGVLGNKHIPMAYLRASVEQRRELVRGLWDSDGYRQAGGSDEITLTCKPLMDGVAELLRSLGLVVRISESDAKVNGRVVGRRWRLGVRFDFNPYRLPRYDWSPRGDQSSRHTQRTITDIRKVDDQATQCIEVDSPSHLFLAGESMVPTHNSAVAAITVLWFATTREAAGDDWKVITTASAWRHLAVYLWPEIHKWARRIRWDVLGRAPFNVHELLALNLKLANGAASAVASSKAELIEGAHADSLLYLIDESKIVPNETWDAIEGAFSGGGRADGKGPEAFALAVSTPGAPTGRFYDIHRRAPGLEDWHVRHVTLEEAVKAGRISREWADQRRKQWGADSALFANRVLGEFHASEEDSVIPLGWVEAAVERWHAWVAAGRPVLPGRHVVGVDVARAGGDATVLAERRGMAITKLEKHDREDTMRTTARVQGALSGTDAVAVVDSIGVGGGVVDRLRELEMPVLAYTGAAATKIRTRDKTLGFTNVRSGAYWHARELLDPAFGAELMLPPDDLLVSDLTTPTWTVVTGNPPRVKLELKDDLIARLGRSPDAGDAVVMALWAENLSASSIHSPAGTSSRETAAAGRYGRSVLGGGPAR